LASAQPRHGSVGLRRGAARPIESLRWANTSRLLGDLCSDTAPLAIGASSLGLARRVLRILQRLTVIHPHHVKKLRTARHVGPLRQFSSQALAESPEVPPEHTEPEHTELCLAFSERPCVYRKAFAGRDRYWRGPRADCCRSRLTSSKRFLLQRASTDGCGRVCQNSHPATGAYARPKSAGNCRPSGRPETRWRLVVLTPTWFTNNVSHRFTRGAL